MTWSVAVATLIAGLMAGVTGIGGVLVVPALTEFAGMSVDRAIAASMFSFLFAGMVNAFMHVRRAQLEPASIALICATGALGAIAGTATIDLLSSAAVRLCVAALAIGSGLHALLARPRPGEAAPSRRLLAGLGLAIGYVSAVSGTGGPVTLIPVLLILGVPAAQSIALGAAIQLPITLCATAVHALHSRVDFALGAMLAAVLIAGQLAGARLFRGLSRRELTVAVAWILIAVGVWYAYATL